MRHVVESSSWLSNFHSPYHIMYPSSSREARCTRSQTAAIPTNHVARAKVYDLRDYTDGSFWGPFKDDGSQDVDWEKVEAVMVVLGYNLSLFAQRATHFEPIWQIPWDGLGPDSFISPPPPTPPSETSDPIDSPQRGAKDDALSLIHI